MKRREFLIGAALVAAGCKKKMDTNKDDPPKGPRPGAPNEGDIELPAGASMPMRRLGRTNVQVSMLGLGGFHIGIPKEDSEGIRIIHAAIDHGVTFMDNCWDYNDGKSEERMGKALADGGKRQKVFLMTKLDARTKDAANEQLEQSLKRLKTDVIDLVQIHEVIRMNDPERAFAPGGVIEALVAAKKAGKIRFIGFTGHKDPDIHLAMLGQKFDWDTVQMPLNVMDAHYKSFEKKVLPVLQQRDIGVLGMKSMGSGLILDAKVVSAVECLRYAMSLPTSVVITGCETMGVLEQALDTALRFKPLTEDEKKDLLARSAPHAADGKLEQFKTTQRFDGTAKNPKWLESATL